MNTKPFVQSTNPRRYLALWFAFLPANRQQYQIRKSANPPEGTLQQPFVFVEKIKGALRLGAVDAKADSLGLGPGLTLADARARVPKIEAIDMDRAADADFLDMLADFCDRYTPLVALDGSDGLILDITGCAHLFGGEANLCQSILARFKQSHIQAQASVAGTPDTARALARFGGEKIVPGGQEAEAVWRLPVAALGFYPGPLNAGTLNAQSLNGDGLDADALNGLMRAGLKTIGDLARQPRQPLATRFGEVLTKRLACVLGEKDARITPRRSLPLCMAEQRFADPIGLESDILATLCALAERTGQILEERGEGGRRFEATLFRADGKVERLTVETGNAIRAPQILERLFRERLDALTDPLDPGFGFDLIRLSVVVCEPLAPGQISLDSTHIEAEELGMLIDRLSTRFGIAAIKRFVPVDTHIPERAVQDVAAIAHAKNPMPWAKPTPGAAPARPIHMFATPQPIETLAEVPDGPPLRFRWRRVLHDIVHAEGPERIAAEWWRKQEMTRDYFRVEDGEGRRYWVFREGLYGVETIKPLWFLHGIFA